ncbi:hypothetical protein ACMC56_16035 [Campylobacterota bacterium DY0563]
MKQIILVRHSEVDIDYHKNITSYEFGKWIEEYNNAKINIPNHINSDLIEIFNTSDIVLSSKLQRSKDTIKLFNKDIFEENFIFNEFEIPYNKNKLLRLKPKMWLVIYRVLWFLGFSKYSESFKESKIRVQLSVNKLIEVSNQYNSIILVGSGLINRFIFNGLSKNGWKTIKKLSNENLGYGILKK